MKHYRRLCTSRRAGFSIHHEPFALKWIRRQTDLAASIVTIESRPVHLDAVNVKLPEAGQQFRPILTTGSQRCLPQGAFGIDANSIKAQQHGSGSDLRDK